MSTTETPERMKMIIHSDASPGFDDPESKIARALASAAAFLRELSATDIDQLGANRRVATKIRANMKTSIEVIETAAEIVWTTGLTVNKIVISEDEANFILATLQNERDAFIRGSRDPVRTIDLDLVRIDETIDSIETQMEATASA